MKNRGLGRRVESVMYPTQGALDCMVMEHVIKSLIPRSHAYGHASRSTFCSAYDAPHASTSGMLEQIGNCGDEMHFMG